MEVEKQKQTIRQEMKRTRLAILPAQLALENELVQKTVVQSDQFKQACYVGVYSSVNNEVLTDQIMREAFKRRKIVALPRTDIHGIRFFEVGDLADLVVGRYNIAEPNAKAKPVERLDVILVPGLAFDKQGYRIGYGKGYYDRFLKTQEGFFVGLAYSFQIFDSIPHAENDMKLHAVATDDRILHCPSN